LIPLLLGCSVLNEDRDEESSSSEQTSSSSSGQTNGPELIVSRADKLYDAIPGDIVGVDITIRNVGDEDAYDIWGNTSARISYDSYDMNYDFVRAGDTANSWNGEPAYISIPQSASTGDTLSFTFIMYNMLEPSQKWTDTFTITVD